MIKKENENRNEEIFELNDEELAQVEGGINTLNQLNRNSGILSGSINNLSAGKKLEPSVDDPSGSQIAEW